DDRTPHRGHPVRFRLVMEQAANRFTPGPNRLCDDRSARVCTPGSPRLFLAAEQAPAHGDFQGITRSGAVLVTTRFRRGCRTSVRRADLPRGAARFFGEVHWFSA